MLVSLINYCFAALFFFVPLVLWPKNFEVFEFNKMMLVYLMTGVITSLWLIRSITQKKLIFTRTPLDLPLLLFLLSQIISTIFSIDHQTSLWGYYSRFHGGLISTISYILLFYAFVSNLNKKHLNTIFYSLLGSATIVALYGIAEHFGIDEHLWVQDVRNRVFSTLGQPNWLSAYLVALLPIPIYRAIYSKDLNKSLIYVSLTLIFLVTIWFTKSQSGIGTTAIILFLIALHQLTRKIKFAYLLLIPLVLGAIYFKSAFLLKLAPLSSNNIDQLVQNDNQTRFGGSDSMVIRQVVWKGAIDIFKRQPIFGTGVETFAYSYYWTRPTAHNLLSEWDFLYNKAHNEYLNFLATTGIVGLATYLFLAISTLIYLLKRKNYSLSLGIISITITNYFGFSVVPVALFFFLYPALEFISDIKETEIVQPKNKKHTQNQNLDTLQYSLIALIVVLLGFWFYIIGKIWIADTKFNYGKQLLEAGYVGYALPSLETAVKLNPNEPVIRASLAEAYAQASLAVQQQFDALPKDQQEKAINSYTAQRSSFIQKSLEQISIVIKSNPYHLNFLKSKAKIELTLSEIDESFTQNALNSLLRANELAPTDAKILYNVGLIYLQLNQPDQAKIAFQKTLELKPDYTAAQEQLDLIK